MIDWLNQNQGSVMALLTAVYVAATVLLTVLTVRSNRLASQSLDLAVRLERERTRPYVTFDIEIKNNGFVWAVLRNIGQRAAKDVVLTLEPPLVSGAPGNERETGLTKTPIAFLPPGKILEDLQDFGVGFLKQYPEPRFNVRLDYADLEGQTFSERHVVDVEVHKHLHFTTVYDIGKELHQLREKIEAAIKRLK